MYKRAHARLTNSGTSVNSYIKHIKNSSSSSKNNMTGTSTTTGLAEKQDKIAQETMTASNTTVIIQSTRDDEGNEKDANKKTGFRRYIFHKASDNPRYIVLALTTIGGFISTFQSSAIVIALPDIMHELSADLISVMWVILAYMLVLTVVVPLAGTVGDMIGRVRLFTLGFFLFCLTSLLCAAAVVARAKAWDFVVYRIIQGVAGALLFANMTPLLTDAFAKYGNLGLVLGINAMAMSLGTIIGPVIGGLLTKGSWRWIFGFSCIVTFIASVISFLFLRNPSKAERKASREAMIKMMAAAAAAKAAKRAELNKPEPKPLLKPESSLYKFLDKVIWKNPAFKFDWPGTIFFSLAITCFLVALSEEAFPTISKTAMNALWGLFGAGVAVYVVIEFIMPNPLISFRLFRTWNFLVAIICSMCIFYVQSTIVFGLIFFFQGPVGQDPIMAGVSCIPFGVGLALMALVSGNRTDRWGSTPFLLLGTTLAALATLGFAFVTYNESIGMMIVLQLLVGMGIGSFNSPNSRIIMTSIPLSRRGTAAGTRLMTSQIMSMVAIIITFTEAFGKLDEKTVIQIFLYGGGIKDETQIPIFMDGFHMIMWISFGLSCSALALSTTLVIPDLIKKRREKKLAKLRAAKEAAAAVKNETGMVSQQHQHHQQQQQQQEEEEAGDRGVNTPAAVAQQQSTPSVSADDAGDKDYTAMTSSVELAAVADDDMRQLVVLPSDVDEEEEQEESNQKETDNEPDLILASDHPAVAAEVSDIVSEMKQQQQQQQQQQQYTNRDMDTNDAAV